MSLAAQLLQTKALLVGMSDKLLRPFQNECRSTVGFSDILCQGRHKSDVDGGGEISVDGSGANQGSDNRRIHTKLRVNERAPHNARVRRDLRQHFTNFLQAFPFFLERNNHTALILKNSALNEVGVVDNPRIHRRGGDKCARQEIIQSPIVVEFHAALIIELLDSCNRFLGGIQTARQPVLHRLDQNDGLVVEQGKCVLEIRLDRNVKHGGDRNAGKNTEAAGQHDEHRHRPHSAPGPQ